MTLKDYLKQTGKPVAEFAKTIKTSRQSVYVFLANSKKRPSLEVAVRIEKATGGLVPVESWVTR